MKSDRRHELQHNELADQLAAFIEKVLPYSKAILGGILAVVVLAFAYVAWSHQQAAKEGKSWNDLFNIVAFNDPLRRDEDDIAADLEKVAQKHQGTAAAQWALLTEANFDLDAGARLLFTDRTDGMTHLEHARKNFDLVERESASSPLVLQQARFGAAQAAEAMGDLKAAKEKYDKAALGNPESAIGKSATARSKMLADEDNKNFVVWFQSQKPKPLNPHAGMPGMPGMGGLGGQRAGGGTGTGKMAPLSIDDLPQAPDIKLPSNISDFLLKKDDKKPDADSPEKKPDADKDPAKKPDGDAKSPDAPPAEKPAEKTTDKPADPAAKDEVKKEAAGPEKPATPPADAKKDEAKKEDAPPAKP